uniref:Uncharacterized protein n=1 Tax=Setaria italica TaxID=4555 RepID=K3YXQ2_SETIT
VVHVYNSDPEVVDAYHKDYAKCQKKLAHLQELPTLKQCKNAANITDWHDLKKKNAVLDVAESVLSLSSSHGITCDNNVYAPNIKVTTHLLDGTTSELTLLFFSKHYNIAFFELMGGSNLHVASLEPELEFGSEALKALDHLDHQKNHYLFIGGSIPKSCTGGALADRNRNVVGMVVNALPNIAFIPSYLILRCLRLWQKFKVSPHLGPG